MQYTQMSDEKTDSAGIPDSKNSWYSRSPRNPMKMQLAVSPGKKINERSDSSDRPS